MARNNKIYFRVDDEELARIQEMAGDDVSGWCREKLMALSADEFVPIWLDFYAHLESRTSGFFGKLCTKALAPVDHERTAEVVAKYLTSQIFPPLPYTNCPMMINPDGERAPYLGEYGWVIIYETPRGNITITEEHPRFEDYKKFYNI